MFVVVRFSNLKSEIRFPQDNLAALKNLQFTPEELAETDTIAYYYTIAGIGTFACYS